MYHSVGLARFLLGGRGCSTLVTSKERKKLLHAYTPGQCCEASMQREVPSKHLLEGPLRQLGQATRQSEDVRQHVPTCWASERTCFSHSTKFQVSTTPRRDS